MRNFSKNIIWALVFLMAISAIYSLLNPQSSEKKEISLSEVVAKINAGEVQSIEITYSTLGIKTKDNQLFSAQKETETGLTETFKNYGVDQAKLKDVDLKVVNRSTFNFFMGFVLPIIVPIIIIALFIWM